MSKKLTDRNEQIKQKALSDLEVFINVVAPDRILGQCHKELIRWWDREQAKSHQLVLLPRDHQKSALVAFRVAWEITKRPWLRVLYISSTAKLAIQQLYFIKKILTSDAYRFFWPEMVHIEEARRERWTNTEICVDHPERKARSVRDPTIFTAGLTTNIVGLHCDIAVLDDVVVADTAYSDEGREKCRTQSSYLASIAGTDSRRWVVGTRYHPLDLYNDMKNMIVEMFSDNGEIESSYSLYEIWEKQVEDRGDGTGQYLWPRQQTPRGDWYGFDQKELAKKKAEYLDLSNFRAQYYNNPNAVGSATITPDMFQYYNRNLLRQQLGKWFYKEKRLNVFAAVDFAYSLTKQADYTAIVVVGVDSNHNYYVLDIDRFKTDKVSEYFDRILRLHTKWGFRKLRCERTAGQAVIIKSLKEDYIRPHGIGLTLEENTPLRNKEERIEAALQPKYSNGNMWHYSGGYCSILEEELIMQKPPHDDCKDCLAAVMEICIPPTHQAMFTKTTEQHYHSRFGGIH